MKSHCSASMLHFRVLAADIGACHVACGTFVAGSGGKLLLQQFALATHNSEPGLEARWSEQTAQSLASIAARGRLGGPVALAVPGHLALTKFIKTPAVEKSKRAKIIQFEASQNIPYPLDEVVWDSAVVADGLDLEVMLTAAKANAMQRLCAAADSAGFPVTRAMPSCLALRHAFRFNYPEIADSVLVVNIGARSTHLLFLESGRFYARTLTLAGNAVTQAIADELRLEFAQAELLKVRVLSEKSDLPAGSPSRAAVQRAAENFCARLQLEIIRSTVNLRRQTSAAQPTAVYLTGGGSLIPALPAALGEKLKLPAKRYEPLRRVELAPGARTAGAADAAPLLADLVGLATHLLVRDRIEASLLPAALGDALAFRRRQPVLLAATALAAVALLPPIWHYDRLATRAQARVAEVEAQLRPLHSLQRRNADHLEQIERAKKQVAALHGLAETKSNWIIFFTDLQSRLVNVEDVWLDRLAVVREPLNPREAAAGSPTLHLALSGRLLDRNNPVSKVSADSSERAKRLLESFAGSQFIASVENERFDNSQPGILRFDFMLVVNPKKTL